MGGAYLDFFEAVGIGGVHHLGVAVGGVLSLPQFASRRRIKDQEQQILFHLSSRILSAFSRFRVDVSTGAAIATLVGGQGGRGQGGQGGGGSGKPWKEMQHL